MKTILCILLFELCMMFHGNAAYAQMWFDCIPPVGPSTEGRYFADAIDLDTLNSTFYFRDARDSRQFTDYFGHPSNDIFYTFVLEQPMDVIIHHSCSELMHTTLHLYKRKELRDYEDWSGSLIEEIEVSDYADYSGTQSIWVPYLWCMTEFDMAKQYQGFIAKKMLGKGTYYVMSEGDRGYNGVIGTTIRGFALDGNQPDYPFFIGKYAQSFEYDDMRDMRLYTPEYSSNYGSDIFYTFTLLRPMDIRISQMPDTISNRSICLFESGGTPLKSSANEDLVVTDLLPGTYKVVSWIGVNQKLTTRFEGQAARLPGDSLVTAISAGRHEGVFASSTHHVLEWFTDSYGGNSFSDVFFKFELEHPMDVHISTCGSEVPVTYVTLLDSAGIKLTDHLLSPGDPCRIPGQAALTVEKLATGVYYAVVEGEGDSGELVVHIEGDTDAESVPEPETVLTQEYNYIFTITPMVETSTLAGLSLSQGVRTVDYFDCFGRPSQTVSHGASPFKRDLVSFREYDDRGREWRQWLPVETNGTGGYMDEEEIRNFSLRCYNGDHGACGYSVYENNPLERVREKYGSGEDWHANGKSVKTDYLLNMEGDSLLNCIHYRLSHVADTVVNIENAGDYASGRLYVELVTDEDGNRSYRFTDKSGRVLLMRQVADIAEPSAYCDTYFIYDSGGRIHAVLPPSASEQARGKGVYSSESSPFLSLYAYFYSYDYRNRCQAKKLPGVSWTLHVYDHADHLVFSQDGNRRSRGEWLFSIPDVAGRTALTGVCKNSIPDLAGYLRGKVVTAVRSATDDGGTYKGYSIDGLLLASPVLHTVRYYDDYSFLNRNGFPPYAYDTSKESCGYGMWHNVPGNSCLHKGLLTGSIRFLSQEDSPAICSVLYYDKYRRAVQIRTSNHLGGCDTDYLAYDFVGNPLRKLHVHQAEGKAFQTEEYTYEYDHVGRLLDVTHRVNSSAPVLLLSNTYDNLGRLKAERKHGNGQLTTRYSYNVRSWLNTLSTNDLFTQKLYYTDSFGGTPSYNGNISAVAWRSSSSDTLRGYRFSYDGLSRLKGGTYGEGTFLSDHVGRFNEHVTCYDKTGNILGLLRYGKVSSTDFGLVDNLNLTYNGNQLQSVSDNAGNSGYGGGMEFKDCSDASVEYSYDSNGNLIQDLNKNIVDIEYNCLNLPGLLKFSDGNTVSYLYDTEGTKLRTVHVIGNDTTVTDYCDNVIYENGVAVTLLTEVGYVSLSDGKYHYFLQDHQGNTRVVVDETGMVEEVNDYYPFGGLMSSSSNSVQSYKYNGKELDRKGGLDWYDYGARHYDAAIGRWCAVDPMAEKYYGWSPYNYCVNNPVRLIDLNGMWPGELLLQPFGRYQYGNNGLVNTFRFIHNTVASVVNTPINLVNGLADETQYIYNNGVGSYLSSGTKNIGNAIGSEVSYRINTPVSQQASDTWQAMKDPENWENAVATAALMLSPMKRVSSTLQGSASVVSTGTEATTVVKVHGNSLKSQRPTWGYKLYSTDGTFLKNGITSQKIPEKRYTKSFMKDKYMDAELFSNRQAAWDWEYQQNLIQRGPLNKNMH